VVDPLCCCSIDEVASCYYKALWTICISAFSSATISSASGVTIPNSISGVVFPALNQLPSCLELQGGVHPDGD